MNTLRFGIATAFCATHILAASHCYGAVPAPDPAMIEVAKDIYLFRAPDIGNLYVDSNSVAVIDDKSVVIFDTGARLSSAQAVLSQIRRLTDKPVSRVVNSHWHPDHWSGNAVYTRAFPGVQVMATTATRDYMTRTVQSMRYVLRKGVNVHRQSAAGAAGASDAATLRIEEEFVAEFERLQPVFPNVTFDGRMVVEEAPRTFELMTLFGDASSVAVAYLPREKVLLAGDVIIYPLPYTPNGYLISRWLESLRSIRALDVAAIVPGHGPVLKDREYLDLLIELISQVTEQVEHALETGVLTADLPQALHLESIGAKFRARTEISESDFDGFVQELTAKVAQESRDGAQFRP
ncbi:MAG TPA: MBL fold metallo-hydrolase [Steroidobacteraceae bacterium]|nr:MBL fold metallo-hydrolase [Steroidobacteraceae bacterium]